MSSPTDDEAVTSAERDRTAEKQRATSLIRKQCSPAACSDTLESTEKSQRVEDLPEVPMWPLDDKEMAVIDSEIHARYEKIFGDGAESIGSSQPYVEPGPLETVSPRPLDGVDDDRSLQLALRAQDSWGELTLPSSGSANLLLPSDDNLGLARDAARALGSATPDPYMCFAPQDTVQVVTRAHLSTELSALQLSMEIRDQQNYDRLKDLLCPMVAKVDAVEQRVNQVQEQHQREIGELKTAVGEMQRRMQSWENQGKGKPPVSGKEKGALPDKGKYAPTGLPHMQPSPMRNMGMSSSPADMATSNPQLWQLSCHMQTEATITAMSWQERHHAWHLIPKPFRVTAILGNLGVRMHIADRIDAGGRILESLHQEGCPKVAQISHQGPVHGTMLEVVFCSPNDLSEA